VNLFILSLQSLIMVEPPPSEDRAVEAAEAACSPEAGDLEIMQAVEAARGGLNVAEAAAELLKTEPEDGRRKLVKLISALLAENSPGCEAAAKNLIAWMGVSNDLGFRSHEALMLAAASKPKDARWLKDMLLSAESDPSHPYRKSDAETVLSMLDDGIDRAITLLDSPDEDSRCAGVDDISIHARNLIIDGKNSEAESIIASSVPKFLNMLSTHPHGQLPAHVGEALRGWASLTTYTVVDGILKAANPHNLDGLPDARLATPAVTVLSKILPEAAPNIAAALSSRLVHDGITDFVAVNSLANLGEAGLVPLLENAKEMRTDQEYDAIAIVLGYSGLKGLNAVIGFCDTSDETQMLTGIRLLSGLARSMQSKGASSSVVLAQALSGERFQAVVSRAQSAGNTELASALIRLRDSCSLT